VVPEAANDALSLAKVAVQGLTSLVCYHASGIKPSVSGAKRLCFGLRAGTVTFFEIILSNHAMLNLGIEFRRVSLYINNCTLVCSGLCSFFSYLLRYCAQRITG
jgi:hypothetical protein